MIRAVFVLAVFAFTAYCLHFLTRGSHWTDDFEFVCFWLLGLVGGFLTVLAYRSDP